VGFPGETDEEFMRTLDFLKEISFAGMHIFKYSQRKGTPAATFSGQVPPEKKEERSNILLELSRKNTFESNGRYTGRVMPVLFEQEVKGMDGFIEGLTANYIRVLCKSSSALNGKMLDVRLDKAVEDYVIAEVYENSR